MPQKKAAFSLVELSIVLVILGLLTGGILAGQSLIRASELRSVSSDYQRYRAALFSFRDKYFGWPGDLTNAVKIWGAQAGGTADGYDATCAALDSTSPSTDTKTCNGNGDGSIGPFGVTTYRYERYRAWQQLANAGLLEGSFTGVTGPDSAYDDVIGSNVPASKISGGGYDFYDYGSNAVSTVFYDRYYGNTLTLGTKQPASGVGYALLKPEEMWNIDSKLDDGKPAYGRVVSYNKTGKANCVTSDTASAAEYNLSYTSAACAVLFVQITQ